MKKGLVAVILACTFTLALTCAASAEWKPSQVVSIVVPANAGGDIDIIARTFA